MLLVDLLHLILTVSQVYLNLVVELLIELRKSYVFLLYLVNLHVFIVNYTLKVLAEIIELELEG